MLFSKSGAVPGCLALSIILLESSIGTITHFFVSITESSIPRQSYYFFVYQLVNGRTKLEVERWPSPWLLGQVAKPVVYMKSIFSKF